MKITKRDIKEIAGSVLSFIENEINSIYDIDKNISKEFDIGKLGRFIKIDLRPSELGSEAYKISYIIQNTGIPIDITLNQALGYSRFIIKAEELANGYFYLGSDLFGNLVQQKMISSISLPDVKSELERLITII